MNKRELKVLEEAFWAEVENRLPYQSRSKLAASLCERGMLQEDIRKIGMVTLSGYCLTHAGRIAYCQSCPDPEETSHD
ncbi:hypothetical protein M1D96_06425 [Pseudomonas sp. D1-3]